MSSEEKPRRRSVFGTLNRFLSSNHNSVVNLEAPVDDPEADADLSPSERDRVFTYQLSLPDPRRLGAEVFTHASIAPSDTISSRIHSALCAASILSPHASDPRIYTSRITRHLPNQVPWISVHGQRKLVGLLFFWEEELVRWTLIDSATQAERAGYESMKQAVQTGASSAGNSPASVQGLWEQHRLALARLEASRRQAPSRRDEAGNRVGGQTPAMGAMPPAYGDNLSTVGVLASPSRESTPMWGRGMVPPGSGAGGEASSRGVGDGGLGEPAMPMPEKSASATR